MAATGGARYREIVAELRHRIEAGELAPGDRVPSTREITRRWGVAMATATKVLTELRHQGLVSPVPGVGTVVAGDPSSSAVTRTPAARAATPAGGRTASPATGTSVPAGRPGSPGAAASARAGHPGPPRRGTDPAVGRPGSRGNGTALPAVRAGVPDPPTSSPAGPVGSPAERPSAPAARERAARGVPAPAGGAGTGDSVLTLERIVAAAVAVADAEGLAAVSMRRVATELGAATMSLYRHVTDKDDLLMRMMDAVMSEWSFPDDPPPGWRGHVEVAARTLWAAFRRHPWLAPALSLTRPQPLAGAVPYAEALLSALDGHGLDVQTVWTTYITVFNYVRGTAVNLEMEAEAEAVSGLSGQEWMEAQEPALRDIVAGGRFPTFERFIRADYDFDIDALFEFGLQRLLDGVATLFGDGS